MSITRWKVGDVIGESECGSFVAYTDHAAAVARLENRLSLAEKVVEAAEAFDIQYRAGVYGERLRGRWAKFANALAAYRSAK